MTNQRLGDEQAAERHSLLLYFLALVPLPRPVVHVPPHHRPVVERIYAHLDVQPTSAPAARPPRRGRLSVCYRPAFGYGTIRVDQIGADSAAEVRRARRDLVETSGCEALLLEMPLAQPGASALHSAEEADGFFFSSIGACFATDGDMLRLQYLATDVDTTRLRIMHPLGRELLAYADAERRRVATAGPPSA
jgi:hypothetical protein